MSIQQVQLNLLIGLPPGEAFNAAIKSIPTDMILSSLEAATLIDKMTLKELIHRHKGNSWESASRLLLHTRRTDFLDYVWDNDQRKKVRATIIGSRKVSDRVYCEAFLLAANGDKVIGDSFSMHQMPERLLEMSLTRPEVRALMCQYFNACSEFKDRFGNWLVTQPVADWPHLVRMDEEGTHILITGVGRANASTLDYESAVALAQSWLNPVQPDLAAGWRSMLVPALRKGTRSLTPAGLLQEVPWPELAVDLISSHGREMTGRDIEPVIKDPSHDGDDTYGYILKRGGRVDAAIFKWLLGGHRNAFTRGANPRTFEGAPRLTDDAVDLITSEGYWNTGTTRANEVLAGNNWYEISILDWVLQAGSPAQLARVLSEAVDLEVLKARLKANNPFSRHLQGLSSEPFLDLIEGITNPGIRCLITRAGMRSWESSDFHEYGPRVADNLIEYAPASHRLARIPLTETQVRRLLGKASAEFPLIGVSLASSCFWVAPESQKCVELWKSAILTVDKFIQTDEDGRQWMPHKGAGKILPALWQHMLGPVSLDWLTAQTPNTLIFIRDYLEEASYASVMSNLTGSTMKVLLCGVPLDWARVKSRDTWEYAADYLQAELGEDRNRWEMAFSLLPGWESSLEDLVKATSTL